SPEPEPLSLIHARLASWLAPDNAEARLVTAQLLQEREQFDLAEPEFEALRRMGQMRPVAELARIDALSRADREDEAEKAALSLTAAYPDLPQGWIALGDLLRQQERFAQAVPAYDKALALLKDGPDEARWFPLYARGIALERSKQFDRAEADLLAAIEINPDQASLLNYLGYSWIDRNENLDRGLDMIQKAAELSPGDGYILDSLAWAYYRLGRYDEAVAPMEEAVGSMASDPLVNDHLGDIYWMVGRHREAEIQWQRALSLKPTETGDVDPDRIRAKLDRGLDAVLRDEARTGENETPVPQAEAASR
nr:tetratricopeptide repeat protein [Paracoccus sp. (in: a-proteobacteria)]